jgi:hypothetical protein
MSIINKILLIFSIVLIAIISIELIYLVILPQLQSQIASSTTCSTPTPTLDLSADQSYRLPNAPDRLTRFFTKASFNFISELTNYNPTKSIDLQFHTTYEGKIEGLYQGKEAQKIYPPDPKYPKRTVGLIINLTDHNGAATSKKTITILLAESELPNLKITNEHGEKLSLNDIKNKQVRINRIIKLPVTKTTDIVTLEPIVYTNIIVLAQ